MAALEKVQKGQNLGITESYSEFKHIMGGERADEYVAEFLLALKAKGETVEEIWGAVTAIQDFADTIPGLPDAIDVCGTGGDSLGTLNISTTVAFVVAGCGIPVAKHGNKAISSKSGSADVLTQLGVKIEADTALVQRSLAEAKLCFMMAPQFHKAMRHVAPVRAKLQTRTIFNLLGPLCNPARTRYQLIGVYDRQWVMPIAEVLQKLGTESAWVVHGSDGLDELTTTGITYVAELKAGIVREFEVTPEQAGLEKVKLEAIKGGDAAYNAERLKALLAGQKDAYRDIVLLNAGAALTVAGKAKTLSDGVEIAGENIDNGNAQKALDRLVTITNS